MLRNLISVTGITQENKLPKKIKGDLLQHSDIEYIFIPSSRPKVKELTHIAIQMEITNQRIIKAPTGTIVVVDGIKKLRISYVPLGHSRKNIQLEHSIPYNTFIEIPESTESLGNVDIYVVDAYFQLVEGRKIYSHTLYMLNVEYVQSTKATKQAEAEMEQDSESVKESREEEPEGSEAVEEIQDDNIKTEPEQDFLSSLREALAPYIDGSFEDSYNPSNDEDSRDLNN